jgi:hypothetical protein
LRRRSKSGRKRPGKGSDKGVAARLTLQIGKPGALTGLNFCSGFVFRTTDAAQIMTATPFFAERGAYHRPLARSIALLEEECSCDPDSLLNKTIFCLRLRFSGDSGYPEIEYDRRAAADFDPSQAPRENWSHILILRIFD